MKVAKVVLVVFTFLSVYIGGSLLLSYNGIDLFNSGLLEKLLGKWYAGFFAIYTLSWQGVVVVLLSILITWFVKGKLFPNAAPEVKE